MGRVLVKEIKEQADIKSVKTEKETINSSLINIAVKMNSNSKSLELSDEN